MNAKTLPPLLELIQRGRDYGMDEEFLQRVMDSMQGERPAGVYAVTMTHTSGEALLLQFARHVRDETERLFETWRISPDQEVGKALADLHDAAIVVLDALAIGKPEEGDDHD